MTGSAPESSVIVVDRVSRGLVETTHLEAHHCLAEELQDSVQSLMLDHPKVNRVRVVVQVEL